jgi:hypothetical protein
VSWDPFTKPKLSAAPARIVRNLTDDDEPQNGTQPEITPFVAGDVNGDLIVTRGDNMPKGQYDRSKSKPRGDAATPAQASAGDAQPKKRAKRVNGAVVAAKAPQTGAARPFQVAVDLRLGSVTINAAAGSLALAADEVLALFAFMARR